MQVSCVECGRALVALLVMWCSSTMHTVAAAVAVTAAAATCWMMSQKMKRHQTLLK
jgi:uncharacterized protein (DUF2062 family)